MSNLVSNLMGKRCIRCGKPVKKPELTHCSDECRFESYLKSESVCLLLDIELI